jgi:hypothetical protein
MNIPKKYLTETIILVESIVQPNDILKILTQDKAVTMGSVSDDPNFQYYKKLVDKVSSGFKQGKNGEKSEIILNKFKLSKRVEAEKLGLQKRYTSLGALLTKLKELMDTKGRYNPSDADSNTIQITTLEILGELTKTPKPKTDTREDPEDEKYPEGKIDWTAYRAKQLAEASKNDKSTSEVLEEFYEFYYRKEYAGLKSAKEPDTDGIVAKLKSLDKILIPEFNKLGYNPEVNPFAQFLKILINQKRDIFNKLTTNTYGAIHNSFIEKHITGNMLGNYSAENILFCNDLYNHKGLDIVNYLALQKQTIDAAENNAKYSTTKKLVAKIFIQQKPLSNTYEANVEKLLEADTVILPEDTNAKLKSELEIQELFQYLFKSVVKKTVNDKACEEILSSAIKQEVVLSMISYILDQHEFVERNTEIADTIKNWLEKVNYQRNEEKIKQCKTILSDYIINVTAEKSIILKLFNYAKAKYEKAKANK